MRARSGASLEGLWWPDRYSGEELGPDWRGFEVSHLGLPVERYGNHPAPWGEGPREITAPRDDCSGELLLRFRLVRHVASGLEVGAHWIPGRGHNIEWLSRDLRVTNAAHVDRFGQVERLLMHRAWCPLVRPAAITVNEPRGRKPLEESEDWPIVVAVVEDVLAYKQKHPEQSYEAIAKFHLKGVGYPVLKKYMARYRAWQREQVHKT